MAKPPPQLKPIALIPPGLKRAMARKFIVPSDPRERALGVVLLGVAIVIAAAASPARDAIALIGANTAPAQFVRPVPFRGQIEQRLVGVYLYRDERGQRRSAVSSRVRLGPEGFAPGLTAAWQPGRHDTVRLVGEYPDRIGWTAVGFAVLGLGLWLRRRGANP